MFICSKEACHPQVFWFRTICIWFGSWKR